MTPAEQRVLTELLKGRTTREMAEDLNLTTRTVETHIHHMLQKSGAKSRFALIEQFRPRSLREASAEIDQLKTALKASRAEALALRERTDRLALKNREAEVGISSLALENQKLRSILLQLRSKIDQEISSIH